MNRASFVFLAICWMRVFFSIIIVVDGIPMPSSSAADRHNRFNPSKGRSRQASPSLNPTRSPNPTRTGRPSGKNMNDNGDEGNGYGDRTRSPTLLPESSSSFPTKKKNAPSVFVSPSSSRPSSTLSPSRFSHTPSYHSPSPEPSFTYSALPSLKHSSSPSQLSHVPSHGSASPSLKHSSSPSQLSHVPSYRSASPSLKHSSSPSELSHVPSYRSVSPSLKHSSSPSQLSHVPSYRSVSPSLKQSASPSQFAHVPSYRSVSPSWKQSASPSYESSSSPSSKDNDLNPSNGDSLAPSSATSYVTSSPPTQTISTSPSTDPTSRDPEPMPSFQDPVTIDRCESMDGVFGSTSNSSVTIFFIYEVQYNASDVSASDVTSSGIQTNILPSLESFMTKLLAKTVFTTGCANGRTSTRYASASVKASLSATGIAMDDLQSAIVGISGWPMDRVITNMSCQSFAGGDENGTNITSSTDDVSHVKCSRVDGRMTIHLFREEEDQVNADVAPTTADDANAEIDSTRRVLKTIRSRRLSNSNENDSIGENVATYALNIIENLMLKGDMDHAHEDIVRVNFIKAKGQVISGRDGDPTNGSMERNQDIGLNKQDGFSTYEKVLLGTACGVAFIVLFFGWTCRKQYLVEKNIGDDAMHQIDSQDTDDGTDDAPFETSQRLDFTMLCLDETTEAEVLNEVEKELGLNSDFDQDQSSDDNVEKEVESDAGSGSGVGDCDGIIGIERVHTIDDLLNVGMHRTIAGAVDDTSSSQDNDECETINFE